MGKLFSYRRSCVLTLMLIAVGCIFVSPARLAAWPLTRSDPPASSQYLLLIRRSTGSAPALEFAKQFAEADPAHRILVMHDFARRAESIGAVPSFHQTTAKILKEAGVETDQIQFLGDGQAALAEEMLNQIAPWLLSQPDDTHITLVTHTLDTGYMLCVKRRTLDEKLQSRIHIRGFDRHGINGTNWWKSDTGLKLFVRAYLTFIRVSLFGEDRPSINWDPDVYEEQLRERANLG